MKQKMSRASGVDCVADAFANGRGLSCSPASRFYELTRAELCLENFLKKYLHFFDISIILCKYCFVADWSSG